MHSSRRVAGIAGVLAAMMVSGPASAATVATDPAGDALYKAPGFMDIVGAEVTKDGDTFTFRTTVAAPIPARPVLPPPASSSIRWAFPIDSDPTTFPIGAPYAPGNGHDGAPEFNIRLFSDGRSFWANLLDRRPLLVGADALIVPLTFEVSGSEVRVAVPAALLGDPSSFRWGAVTAAASATPDSNLGFHHLDALGPFYNLWP